MAAKSKQSIAQQLHDAQLIISNSLSDHEIQDLVSVFGYSAERLNAAKELYNAALTAFTMQKAKAGAQQQSTRMLAEAEATARDAYQALAKVARAVFIKDKAQLAALGLTGREPENLTGFLTAAYTLFDNAPNLPVLAEYGYGANKLQAERGRISSLDQANKQQEAAKGAAQQATCDRDAALRILNDWVSQYRKIARVALRKKKQLLEKIGLVARTSKSSPPAPADKNS